MLIAVLWFGLGVAAVASYLAVSAQFQVRQAVAEIDRATFDLATMEAAAHWTIAALRQDDAEVLERDEGQLTLQRDFGGQSVTISIVPLETMVDLNIDDVGRMALAFADRGLDEDAAAALAARIVDFRDADSLRSLNGAERDDYAAAGRPGPRNDAFAGADDVALVLGATPEAVAAIRPILTVQSRPVEAAGPTRVVATGNRIDPVGGKRNITHLRRPGLLVRISHADGAVREFTFRE